jgi:hypothetical protein
MEEVHDSIEHIAWMLWTGYWMCMLLVVIGVGCCCIVCVCDVMWWCDVMVRWCKTGCGQTRRHNTTDPPGLILPCLRIHTVREFPYRYPRAHENSPNLSSSPELPNKSGLRALSARSVALSDLSPGSKLVRHDPCHRSFSELFFNC